MKKTLESRFESQYVRVPFSGCWLWTGAIKNQFGHGAFKLGSRASKVEYSHRQSWVMHKGPIPDGLCVCHSCDVPSCVNPDHLFLGTQADNMKDKVLKGRQLSGSKTYVAKIDESIAKQIKQQKSTPTRLLASMFGISRQSVADIVYGRTWKHV